MLIKYTGSKEKKKVIHGNREYIFDPYLEVNEFKDKSLINFLLHDDRKGLFINADKEDQSAPKKDKKTPKKDKK